MKQTLRLELVVAALNTTVYYNILVDTKFNFATDSILAASVFSFRTRAHPRGDAARGDAGDVVW